MPFKWVIKRIKDDPIKVSEKVGKQALDAWRAGISVISLPNDINISSGTITAVEPTYEAQEEDDVLSLMSGITEKKVVLDMDGKTVITNWYKRNVGGTAWEKKYAALPWYHKIVDDDKNVWVAMRLPAITNQDLPKELVPCTEYECKLLDEILSNA